MRMFHICCFKISQQIAQLELLCQQFYESMDINVRSEAEKALVNFSDSPESLPQCQIILERSQVPHGVYCEPVAAGLYHVVLTPASLSISEPICPPVGCFNSH